MLFYWNLFNNTFTILLSVHITTAYSKSFQSGMSSCTHYLLTALSIGNSLYRFQPQQLLSLTAHPGMVWSGVVIFCGVRQHGYFWFQAPQKPWPYFYVGWLWLSCVTGLVCKASTVNFGFGLCETQSCMGGCLLIFCCPSTRQSFLVSGSTGCMTIFFCLTNVTELCNYPSWQPWSGNFLLTFASTVILGFRPCRTHYYIFVSHYLRVLLEKLLLTFANTVILGSRPCGTMIVFLSQPHSPVSQSVR
jgi:hypothetical protein